MKKRDIMPEIIIETRDASWDSLPPTEPLKLPTAAEMEEYMNGHLPASMR
jgi:hypothetical protein